MRALTALMLTAGAAMAETPLPQGCFAQAYDAAHLASHPLQVVEELRLYFEPPNADDDIWVVAVARLANQGRAAERGLGGQELDQVARCAHYNSGAGCAVDCDGGSFRFVEITPERIEIGITGFPVGETDSCGGAFNLAEVFGEETIYRLFAAPDEVCLPD